jgi:hypothetical protein
MPMPGFRNWDDPASRAMLRPGSILIDFAGDCYCFPVKEIHDDGVLAWYVDEWKHFTWTALSDLGIALYDQIDPANIRFCGPLLRERGGRFDDLSGATPPSRGRPAEDWELAAALAEVWPVGIERVVLYADHPEGSSVPPSIRLDPPDVPLTLRIRTAVAAHREAMGRKQISGWNGLAFTIQREADAWKTGAEFDYY